jgi:hypothetical protein
VAAGVSDHVWKLDEMIATSGRSVYKTLTSGSPSAHRPQAHSGDGPFARASACVIV